MTSFCNVLLTTWSKYWYKIRIRMFVPLRYLNTNFKHHYLNTKKYHSYHKGIWMLFKVYLNLFYWYIILLISIFLCWIHNSPSRQGQTWYWDAKPMSSDSLKTWNNNTYRWCGALTGGKCERWVCHKPSECQGKAYARQGTRYRRGRDTNKRPQKDGAEQNAE